MKMRAYGVLLVTMIVGVMGFVRADSVWEASSGVVSVDTTFEDGGHAVVGCEIPLTVFPGAELTTGNGVIRDGRWKPSSTGVGTVELRYGGYTLQSAFSVADEVPPYTIQFNANDDIESVLMLVFEPGRVYNLPANPFAPPEGKRFVGWTGSNGRRYDDRMLVFNIGTSNTVVTLTAIWE